MYSPEVFSLSYKYVVIVWCYNLYLSALALCTWVFYLEFKPRFIRWMYILNAYFYLFFMVFPLTHPLHCCIAIIVNVLSKVIKNQIIVHCVSVGTQLSCSNIKIPAEINAYVQLTTSFSRPCSHIAFEFNQVRIMRKEKFYHGKFSFRCSRKYVVGDAGMNIWTCKSKGKFTLEQRKSKGIALLFL
jgi:hypothetical protein